MSADPIIYCLENLTDYSQFERLCVDLMGGSGYPHIEPLGGTGDRGRDALQIDRQATNQVTIFAFSVRSDWRTKLLADCERIAEEKHTCHRVVFVTTSNIQARQRDEMVDLVQNRHGWTLDLYPIERIRTLLAGPHKSLLARHPAIFCPPWFDRRGGLVIEDVRDTLVIDHAEDDHAFATWLARKLLTFGYPTWCYGAAPLAGENADETVRLLIGERALRYLPVLSRHALDDRDLMDRCAVAASMDQLMIPCHASQFPPDSISERVRRLTPATFHSAWSQGLRELLDALDAAGIEGTLDTDRGREIALSSYMPEPLVRQAPERVFANVFPMQIPNGFVASELTQDIDQLSYLAASGNWAFTRAEGKVLLSFEPPPADIKLPIKRERRYLEYAWQSVPERYGRNSRDVARELARKSLLVACRRAGFAWCNERQVYYLPQNLSAPRRDRYIHVDGRSAWVSLAGERSYRSLGERRFFNYQLGPTFRVGQDEDGAWWMTLRLYVRVTDEKSIPLDPSQIPKRRKQVTRNWWNKEWFSRTLAMAQAISGGTPEIIVGAGRHAVTVSVKPLEWSCPVSIDVLAMDHVGEYQEELAATRIADDEDDDETPDHEEAVKDE